MKNQLKFGVLLSYFTIFTGLFVSIIYTPYMLNVIGENQYGIYTLISSLVGYLGLLNFGLSSSYMRYFANYRAKNDEKSIKKLNGMFLIVFICIAIVILVIGYLILPYLGIILGENIVGSDLILSKKLFSILVINLTIPLFTTVFNVYTIAHERFVFLKFVSLLKTIIVPLFMSISLSLGYESIGMAVVTLFFSIVFEITIVFFSLRKLRIKFLFSNLEMKLIGEIIVFSSYIFINMLIDQINWSVDKFLIGRINGTFAVAIYGIASQINSYYLMISSQVSSVFVPKINSIIANGNTNDELSKLFVKIGRIQFMILGLVLIGFIGFGETFIVLWAGESYRAAYSVILILIITVTVPLIQNIGIEIQRAKNMHKFRSIVYLFIAILNIVISIPLISKFGPVGAAIGTGVSLIIGNGLIMNWYYHKFIKLNVRLFWKNIFNICKYMIPSLLFAIISKNLFNLDRFLVYICLGILYLIIYVSSIWFFAMNQDEKSIITKPIVKFTQHF